MNSDEGNGEIDRLLELLANPLTRKILAILAGIDPNDIEGDLRSRSHELLDEFD